MVAILFFCPISVQVFDRNGRIADSGDLYDTTIAGGRLGVFVYNQVAPVWSNLVAWCGERENEALTFDGVDDSVYLGTVSEIGLEERFVCGQPTSCCYNTALIIWYE